jgi:hypothetical protein
MKYNRTKVFVLIDYDHKVYGVYLSETEAWDHARNELKNEGVPADELTTYLEDWSVTESSILEVSNELG